MAGPFQMGQHPAPQGPAGRRCAPSCSRSSPRRSPSPPRWATPIPTRTRACASRSRRRKAVSMPKDIIERAIKKAAGGDAENYEEIRYEGYGPNGVAVIVEAMTDNRNRTASNVRSTFTKRGGNLGETGSVGFLFDRKGEIVYTRRRRRRRGDDGGDRGRRRGRRERRGRPLDLVRRRGAQRRSRPRWRRRSARRRRPSWSGGRRPRPSSTSRRRRA